MRMRMRMGMRWRIFPPFRKNEKNRERGGGGQFLGRKIGKHWLRILGEMKWNEMWDEKWGNGEKILIIPNRLNVMTLWCRDGEIQVDWILIVFWGENGGCCFRSCCLRRKRRLVSSSFFFFSSSLFPSSPPFSPPPHLYHVGERKRERRRGYLTWLWDCCPCLFEIFFLEKNRKPWMHEWMKYTKRLSCHRVYSEESGCSKNKLDLNYKEWFDFLIWEIRITEVDYFSMLLLQSYRQGEFSG